MYCYSPTSHLSFSKLLFSSRFLSLLVSLLRRHLSLRSNGGRWSKTCDSCRTSPCAIYCRADSAYLCAGCDARIHASNSVALRHERVWVCEACEQAPAAFTCKADAAALCTTCDTDIHSANPLARRHHRVPIMPISVGLYGPSTNRYQTTRALDMKDDDFLAPQEPEEVEEETEDEAASWLLLNPVKNNHRENNNGFLFGEGDEYLDLVEYNSCTENQFQDQYNPHQHNFLAPHDQTNNDRSDSVVPVQIETVNEQDQQQVYQREMDYETSKPGFSYTPSMSHSVSFSSMDASIVPDNTMSDISNSHSRPPKGTIDLFSSPPIQIPPQFNPMDREARVLRYREKKKMRKFEKTIRYASRKAYAETRPRIKGRFAKRTDVDLEVEQMFSTSVMAESGYGIVPSF